MRLLAASPAAFYAAFVLLLWIPLQNAFAAREYFFFIKNIDFFYGLGGMSEWMIDWLKDGYFIENDNEKCKMVLKASLYEVKIWK